MRFLVRKEFLWEGKVYTPGDGLELPERHPRLAGMLQGRFLMYDTTPDDEAKRATTEQEMRQLGALTPKEA